MTGTLFLRPADPSDLEPVFAIVQRAARHMDSQGIHQWDSLYPAREDLAEDITRGELWVGTVKGQVRSLGGSAVCLDVFSQNPHALRLYTKLGYAPVGTVRWRMGDFILMENKLVR